MVSFEDQILAGSKGLEFRFNFLKSSYKHYFLVLFYG